MCIAGYNCTIEYLNGRDCACADLLSRLTIAPSDNLIKQVDVDDMTYEVCAINSNNFESWHFATFREVLHHSPRERPTLLDIDAIRAREEDRDILELKRRFQKCKANK